MTLEKIKYAKTVAARLRRRIENNATNQELFWEDLDMLLDLILGGEA